MNDYDTLFKEVTDRLAVMTPFDRNKAICAILDQFGYPRTLIIEQMGWLGVDAVRAQSIIDDVLDRSKT